MKKRYSLATLAVFCASTMFLLFNATCSAQLPSYVPANGLVAWYPFNGNANDESGNGNNGVVNGAVLTADRNGVANSAYYFSGSGCGSRIDADVNTSSIQTGLTISLWLQRIGNGCISPRILEFWPGNNGPGIAQWSWAYGYPNAPNVLGFGSATSTNFNCVYGISNPSLTEWIQIVYANDGLNGKFFYNGDLVATVPSTGSPILAGDLAIGRMNHPAYDAFNGKIDDLGIWNRALTEAEVQALYTSQSTPVCNLGSITTPASTICAGESISLIAQPSATAGGCFNPKVKQAGNQNFGITSTHRDAQGNYYMSGAYSGATTIDGIAVSSIGNRDIFLAKYNSCGQIQWVARGGSSGDQDYAGEGSHGIATDASGNVYIVGRYNQAFTFYGANSSSFSAPWTSTSNANHQDGFLVKLNSSGQVVWGASLRGTSNDGFVGVAVDGAGNPVVTGGFNGCCPSSFAVTIYGPNGSVGVSSFGSNYGSGLVVKFDANGNILWKAAVYNRDTGLSSVAIDGSNNIYLTSSFRSWSNGTAAQFIDASGANNSLFNPGIGLGFLVKLNASGNWQWGTSFGNVGDGVGSLTSGADVAIDASGNPWVVGYFRGAQATVYSTNGANLTIPASTNDIGFLISYNASGVAQSVVTRQQSTGATYYRSLAIANNKIVVAGHFTGANAGLSDILLANYTSAGSFIDAQVAGGAGDDYGLSIIPSNSAFAVCGSTAGGFTLDGVSVPSACTYLWNLGAAQGQATVSWSNGATTPTISVSPSTTTTYTATFSDGTNACSKEVTVTVNQPTSSAIEATITEGETYNFNGQSLTTAGTYEAVLVNAAGCDSTVSLTLSVEPSVSCSIESALSVCAGDSVQLVATDSGFQPCSGSNQGALQWELLIPSTAYNNAEINFDPAGFDRATSTIYSALKNSSINRVYSFNLNTNQVTSLPSVGGPGELYEVAFDYSNQRLLANRVGRDAVYSLPLTGGTWTQIGSGGFDAESYGANTFWNPISQRFSYFGGYGYFAVKNWVWENNGSGWVNTYGNNDSCNPAKRIGQISLNGTGDKVYVFSGQGSCAGNQTASSCTLGSPWATDVGVYCWLRDIWELNLQNMQFTNVLPVNSQSITREGAFVYDYENDDFYIIGGFVPSGNYSTNVNNYGNTWSNETLRFRRGQDSGFSPISVGGTLPPVSSNSLGSGTAYYDANYDRIILARKDGIWALNLSSCDKTYAWSTGETTPSITVSPTETTTYSVTVTQGSQTCTSDVTITVNQPSFSAIEATITEGETYNFNGQSLTTAGTYEAVLANAAGCDSTVTLTLSVEPGVNPLECSIANSANSTCLGESIELTVSHNGSISSNGIIYSDTKGFNGPWQIDWPVNPGENYILKVTGEYDITVSPGANFDAAYVLDDLSPYNQACEGYQDKWKLSENCPARPNPDVYNPSHIYFYEINNSDGIVSFSYSDCCYGDNSGSMTFELFGNVISTDVLWSTGDTIPSITVSPTETTTYSVTVTQGAQTCTSEVTITVLPNATYYADADGDGFGNFEMPLTTCDVIVPEGYTLDNTDCNDGDPLNYPFASCDDGDVCTIEDVIQEDCTCAGFFADSDGDGTCDAEEVCQGTPEPGTACDDNDPCTANDLIQADCTCFGTIVDEDNDGVCDLYDTCIGAEAGTACDDNDPCTVNDIILADCSCAGTFADADNDGTCDANDNCAGPEAGTACDDNDPCTVNDIIREDCSCVGVFIDSDEDGVCDANDLCAGPEAGSICDDNNPCTVDDVILADCSCAGTIADSDNDGVCDAFDLCFGPEPGSSCDDANPCTINDVVNEACTCMGEPVAVNTSITSATACDSYAWNGQQYTASGTYTFQTTNAAGCDSIATLVLEIRQSSLAPQSASASLTTITAGQSVTLSAVGGSLGTNAQWMWYSGSCGGTLVGQGTTISVSPSANTTYFVRAVGTCNTTGCASVTVNVSDLPCGPQSITASSTSICAGNAVTLSVTGVLSSGAVWKWYKNGCGLGTSVGTGATIAVIPTTNTSYFVRAEGGSCGLTNCLSVAISVSAVPAKPTVITGPAAALCSQQGVVYSTPQLAGVISYMWTVPSGATIVSGQGTSSITVNFSSSIGPNSTCGYTGICVSALNGCGASLHHCMQVSLTPGIPAGINASTNVCRFEEATFSVVNPIAGLTYTWEVPNNWQILSGQGTSTITAMVGLNNGQVRVYATNTCGMSKKFSRYVGPINCNRTASSLQLDLWPNPASQNVKFAHGGIQPEILEIYDLLGREIYRGDWVGEWNVETLEAGIYFVRVTHQGESVVKRLEVAR